LKGGDIMETKANFSIKNVDNKDKESYDMNYQIMDCASLENLRAIKSAIDEVVSLKFGALVSKKLENEPESTN